MKNRDYNVLILFFIGCHSIGCHSLYGNTLELNNGKKKVITIVNNCTTPNLVHFSYLNYYDDEINPTHFIKDGKIQKTIQIETENSLFIYFSRNFLLYPIFLEPGDTLEIDCNNISNSIEFTGTKPYQELNFFIKLERKYGFSLAAFGGINYTEKLNLDYLYDSYKESLENSLVFLENYRDSVNLSSNFVKIATEAINFKYFIEYLTPYFYLNNLNISSVKNEHQSILNSLALRINNDSLLFQRHYKSFLYLYNIFLCRNNHLETDFNSLFELAKREFNGDSRNYLLFKLIKSSIGKGLNNFSDYLDDFRENCTNQCYIQYIDSLSDFYKPKTLNKFAGVTIDRADGYELTFEKLLGKKIDTVLYIDFWASWCRPCLEEMTNYQKLIKELMGEKISFIFISIDKNKISWLKSLKLLPFKSELSNHYLLDESSLFSKWLQVPPIPKYIILSKNHEIIALDAQQPSDPNLIDTLRRIINDD